jgi:hypothetical protein
VAASDDLTPRRIQYSVRTLLCATIGVGLVMLLVFELPVFLRARHLHYCFDRIRSNDTATFSESYEYAEGTIKTTVKEYCIREVEKIRDEVQPDILARLAYPNESMGLRSSLILLLGDLSRIGGPQISNPPAVWATDALLTIVCSNGEPADLRIDAANSLFHILRNSPHFAQDWLKSRKDRIERIKIVNQSDGNELSRISLRILDLAGESIKMLQPPR